MKKLEGIHHVTAITADAQPNVDFYAGVLGMPPSPWYVSRKFAISMTSIGGAPAVVLSCEPIRARS